MIYSVDTSALVDAWRRWYPPDTHPSLWVNIDAVAQEGRLFISDMVLEELYERDDELASWCDEREPFLCQPSDDAVQEVLREVINAHPNLGATIPGGKNFADPYVIAAAHVRSATVISHENRTGNLNGPKIPDVCRVYGIEYRRLPDLIRAEGWRF